jgi:hypothetical protein
MNIPGAIGIAFPRQVSRSKCVSGFTNIVSSLPLCGLFPPSSLLKLSLSSITSVPGLLSQLFSFGARIPTLAALQRAGSASWLGLPLDKTPVLSYR